MRLFAKIIRESLSIIGFDFTKNNSDLFLNFSESLIERICSKINCSPNGNVVTSNPLADDLMRAILDEFYRGNMDACKRLAMLFQSNTNLKETYKRIRQKTFSKCIEVKGKSRTKYNFWTHPLKAKIPENAVIVMCKINPKSHLNELLFIKDERETDLADKPEEYLDKPNCLLYHPELEIDKRLAIIEDIKQNKSYTKLKYSFIS